MRFLGRPPHDRLQGAEVEPPFEQVVEDAYVDAPPDRLDVVIPRHDHDLGLGAALVQALRQGEAVHPGHHEVHESHLVEPVGGPAERLLRVGGGADLVAARAQQLGQGLGHGRLVIHDEDANPLRLRQVGGGRVEEANRLLRALQGLGALETGPLTTGIVLGRLATSAKEVTGRQSRKKSETRRAP